MNLFMVYCISTLITYIRRSLIRGNENICFPSFLKYFLGSCSEPPVCTGSEPVQVLLGVLYLLSEPFSDNLCSDYYTGW